MEKIDHRTSDKKLRLTIRISANHLSFAVGDPQQDGHIAYEQYELNNGISIAANLREAFNRSELLQSGFRRTLILIDNPVMLVPTDEFQEQDVETLYKHTLKWRRSDDVVTSVLPDLNAVAVFTINKDLRLVVDDHFEDVRIQPMIQAVWSHLHHRASAGSRRKMFVYYHEKQLEVFSFQQNRFRFSNSYEASSINDMLYFILYAWKEIGMNAESDELHLAGNIPNGTQLNEEAHKFLQRCYLLDQEIDFNNNSFAKRKDIPYDLKALYLS